MQTTSVRRAFHPVALLLAAALSASAAAQATTRASVDSTGQQAVFENREASMSADGRYIAFESDATNLVPGDTNISPDVFVRDTQTGQTTRVSVTSSGAQSNDGSASAAISADGRYVAFRSFATNLVVGDNNFAADVFVHDRQTAQTTRISTSSAGAESDGGSYSPSLSSDGRYVAFWSYAGNLVAGDTNGWADVFVRDRQTGQTTRVSVDSAGVQSDYFSNYPSISADGRYVAFESSAANLVPGDDVALSDVFVHDRQTALTTRVSADSNGVKGISPSLRPSISADGRYVAFESQASNLVIGDTNNASDVFVHDRITAQTTRVSVGAGGAQADFICADPAISANARFVTFTSLATNLVAGDTNQVIDVFVHDRQTGQTTRASVATAGTQANNGSIEPVISGDGRYVAFASLATNLVLLDTNTVQDIFQRDRGAQSTWTSVGSGLAGASGIPQLGANGDLGPGGTTTFPISNALPSTIGALVLGVTNVSLPIYGGTLVPQPQIVLSYATSASGTAQKSATWPITLPSGLSVYAQAWVLDAAGVQGFAATIGRFATAP